MRIAFAIIAALIPIQAHALSCIRPDTVRSYAQADEASEAYVIVKGKFSFTQPPEPDLSDSTPTEYTAQATFTGTALGKQTFDISFSRQITVHFTCAGPWCGRLAPDTETLAFVKRVGRTLSLDVDPCGTTSFAEPEREDIERLLYCHTRGICEPRAPGE